MPHNPLNNHFYTLIGAMESAIKFLGVNKAGSLMDANPAHGDPHLDPLPGTVGQAKTKLREIKDALVDAESVLETALEAAGSDAPKQKGAWDAFWATATDQSYKFASVMRRLLWTQTGPNEDQGIGGFGWHKLEPKFTRILKVWAEVGCGGGGGHGVADPSGIFGSSGEYISLP